MEPTITDTNQAVREDAVARMRRLRSERRSGRSGIMADVLSAYFGTKSRDETIEKELDHLIDAFIRVEDAAAGAASRRVGRLREGCALSIIGESGAGKTRISERHFHKREEFAGYGDRDANCILVSVTAPAPCTLALLGHEILKALGYETERQLRENVVWKLVRHHLRLRGVRFLHIDELQHLVRSRNPVEIGKVRDTLKNLMQDKERPMWLILSGTREIAVLVSPDPEPEETHGADREAVQVWRRSRYVNLEDLTVGRDAELVRRMIAFYCGEKAKVSVEGLATDDFIARLLHAALNQFGIAIEFIQDAIEQALDAEKPAIELTHFADAYASRTGCRQDENVFTAREWWLIDPRKAVRRESPPPPPEETPRRPRDWRGQ